MAPPTSSSSDASGTSQLTVWGSDSGGQSDVLPSLRSHVASSDSPHISTSASSSGSTTTCNNSTRALRQQCHDAVGNGQHVSPATLYSGCSQCEQHLSQRDGGPHATTNEGVLLAYARHGHPLGSQTPAKPASATDSQRERRSPGARLLDPGLHAALLAEQMRQLQHGGGGGGGGGAGHHGPSKPHSAHDAATTDSCSAGGSSSSTCSAGTSTSSSGRSSSGGDTVSSPGGGGASSGRPATAGAGAFCLRLPKLDLTRVKIGVAGSSKARPGTACASRDDQPVSEATAAREAELCFEQAAGGEGDEAAVTSTRFHLHPKAPMQDSRCYHYRAIGHKELAVLRALMLRLPRDEAHHVQLLWDAFLTARRDCEAMAARGVRVSRDVSRDWQETVSDLIDRVVAQDAELGEMRQKLKTSQAEVHKVLAHAAAATTASAAQQNSGSAGRNPASGGGQQQHSSGAGAAATNSGGARHSADTAAELQDLHEQVVRLKRQRDKLKRQHLELTDQLTDSQFALQKANNHASETQGKLSVMTQKAQDLQCKHNHLVQQNKQLAAYAEGLDAAMHSQQQSVHMRQAMAAAAGSPHNQQAAPAASPGDAEGTSASLSRAVAQQLLMQAGLKAGGSQGTHPGGVQGMHRGRSVSRRGSYGPGYQPHMMRLHQQLQRLRLAGSGDVENLQAMLQHLSPHMEAAGIGEGMCLQSPLGGMGHVPVMPDAAICEEAEAQLLAEDGQLHAPAPTHASAPYMRKPSMDTPSLSAMTSAAPSKAASKLQDARGGGGALDSSSSSSGSGSKAPVLSARDQADS